MTETIGLVQQFVERTGQLYSLPAVAAEVLRLTAEPTIDARALKECLERDPALATRLLRVVNSSLFGLSRQVTDLGQALAVLGIRPLKMLVLGFSLPKELFSELEANVLAAYWRRTLVKAIAARELAERLWQIPGDEPFIAGLVQDIGQLALIQQLGPSYQQFLDHVQTHGGNLLDRELETLGFDHMVLSARLLRHWGLPLALSEAVAVPPNEARIGLVDPAQRTLPQILHLADLVARLIEQPYGVALRDLLASGGRYCGLTYEKLQPIVGLLQERVEELAEVLALELPADTSYVDLLLSARQALADETVSAAAALTAPEAEDKLLALARQLQSDLAVATGRASLHRPARAAAVESSPSRPATARQAKLAGAAPSPPATGSSQYLPLPLGEGHPRRSRGSRGEGSGIGAKTHRRTTTAIDPCLTARVAAAIQRARQARRPVTLALFEIERFGDLLVQFGPVGIAEFTHWLRLGLSEWTGDKSEAVLVGESCYALVWDDCPRSEGVRLARHALAEVKPWSRERLAGQAAVALSAGLATVEFPPKNYPPQELIDAAHRCLGGAQLSGGDTVKSIET